MANSRASYRALGASDCDPMWSPNWFDPLGRDRRVGGDEAPAGVVDLLEERRPEGVMVILVTRNRT